MIKRTIDYFYTEQICNSGQCFRMEKRDGNRYSVIVSGKYLEVEQNGKDCTFFCEKEDIEGFWKAYFDPCSTQARPSVASLSISGCTRSSVRANFASGVAAVSNSSQIPFRYAPWSSGSIPKILSAATASLACFVSFPAPS